MMRIFVTLALTLIATFAVMNHFVSPASAAPQTYSDRYDHVDIDAILSNRRLLDGYVKCFLAADDAPCDRMSQEVKAVLPEALSTNCAKCTANQRKAMRQVVRHLAKERPDVWEKVQAKLDPGRTFAKANPDLLQ